jgi:outer membrane protein assembly factor BamB
MVAVRKRRHLGVVRPRRWGWHARAVPAALVVALAALLLPLSPTAAAVVGAANWSQYRYGSARLGLNHQETVLSPSTVSGLRQAWVTTTGDFVAEPAVVDGVVYVGSADRKVYALNAATGATIWTATTGGPVRSSPAVVDGMVYVGSADGKVYALNAATGATRWTVTTGGPVRSSPAVVDGVVYIGSADRRVYALDAATGATVWTATTGGEVSDPPAVVDGVVHVRSRDGSAYALDAATGAIVWTASIGGRPMFGLLPGTSSPAVADGMVYVAGPYNGRLYALDAATGATVWTATRGDTVGGTPAVADGIVYALLGRGLGSADLVALHADTGAMVWTVPGSSLSSPSSVSPVVANGVLYTGTVAGVLVARTPATGAVLWSDGTAGGSNRSYYASLVVANGAVYAGRGVAVSAHRLQNPSRRTRLDGPARRPAPR